MTTVPIPLSLRSGCTAIKAMEPLLNLKPRRALALMTHKFAATTTFNRSFFKKLHQVIC
jgi:hypothetical protein